MNQQRYGRTENQSLSCTSIGFGDIVPVTLVGRLLTVWMTLHEIFIIAIIPGVIVNCYQEIIQLRAKESLSTFLNQLEHLPELSKEELEDISNRVNHRKVIR